MAKVPQGEVVIQTIAMPADTNENGDIFGGWLVSQMDIGGAVLAKQISKKRVVTIAIDKMVFLQPVHVGDTVTCYAKLLKTGNTSMMINIEAWAFSNNREARVKVTDAIFTFVTVDANGSPIPVHDDAT